MTLNYKQSPLLVMDDTDKLCRPQISRSVDPCFKHQRADFSTRILRAIWKCIVEGDLNKLQKL